MDSSLNLALLKAVSSPSLVIFSSEGTHSRSEAMPGH